jgi:hypothetical protein
MTIMAIKIQQFCLALTPGPRGVLIKTFCGRNLCRFVIIQGVFVTSNTLTLV